MNDTTRKQAISAIEGSEVLRTLRRFNPKVVSTILVDLHVEDSDIDIVCCYHSAEDFIEVCERYFAKHADYSLDAGQEMHHVRFRFSGFLFEITASEINSEHQLAYRHHQLMQRLVRLGGDPLIIKIRKLRSSGLKVEPALAQLFGLDTVDPYASVLAIEDWSDGKIREHLENHVLV